MVDSCEGVFLLTRISLIGSIIAICTNTYPQVQGNVKKICILLLFIENNNLYLYPYPKSGYNY